MKNKNINIEYTYKKENDYLLFIFLGGISLFLFIQNLFSLTSNDIIPELIMGCVTVGFLYYGYNGYKKRHEEKTGTSYINIEAISYKIKEEKKPIKK